MNDFAGTLPSIDAPAESALTFPADSGTTRRSPEERATVLDDPGYGRYFTDHMAVASWTAERGWSDGRITQFRDLSLSPASAVLHYGQAVFEGLKVYRHPDSSLWSFKPLDNARRFQRSAERITLPALPSEAFLQAAQQLVAADADWVPAREESSLYLRPFLYADEPYLGNRPARSVRFCLIASPAASYFPAGPHPIDVWVSSRYIRAARGGTGEAKFSGNYAAALIAQLEASAHGCEHVLFLDALERRWVEELGAMNVFAVYGNGKVATPPLSGSILPGITRGAILTLLAELGHDVAEEPLAIDTLLNDAEAGHLTELFACGTAAVVTGVGRLVTPERSVVITEGAEPGPVTRAVRRRLVDLQYGLRPDSHGWLHPWTS